MKNIIKILVIVGILFSFSFAYKAEANSFCANGSSMTLQEFFGAKSSGRLKANITFNGTSASVHITNTTGCTVPLVVSSYKVHVYPGQSGWLNTQEYITDSGVINMTGNGSIDLVVPMASCMTQVDVWYQTAPRTLYDGNSYPEVLDGTIDFSKAVCKEQTNPLYASCTANPTSANTNQTVNWYATATGGIGSYTYSWSGTDGLSGSNQTVSKSYSSAGSKTGTVTVTSGSETKTVNCFTNVNTPQTPSLYVSCQPNYYSANTNQTITWSANANGGTGSYTYSWSGTDGLSGSGQSVSRNYPYTGTKTATVTVNSGDKSASATCNTSIYAVQSYYYNYQDAVLGGSCYASSQNTQVGNNITWYVNAYGGNNYYTYYWNGSDGLSGSGQYAYKTYSTPGQKYANVTITSGGQSITRTCEVNVGQVLAYTQTSPTLTSVYLSDLPYTGIEDYKIPMFVAGLALWSLIVAMVVYKRRENII